jgi:transcription-repair coupling factor (superfamily II helicase)
MDFKQHITASKPFEDLRARLRAPEKNELISVRGVAGSLMALVCASVFDERKSQILLVVPDAEWGERLRDDCAMLLGETQVKYLGPRPAHHAESLDVTSSIARVETLKALTLGQDVVVVAPAQSITARVPHPDQFTKNTVDLRTNTQQSFTTLIDTLADLGFERKQFVEGYGDFSVRGGIIDVFPFIGENPLRVEFWGDTVESIREFDILSQRSMRELEAATIVPDAGRNGNDGPGLGAIILDYLKSDALIFLDEPELIRREVEELKGGNTTLSWNEIEIELGKFPRVVHSMLKQGDRAIDFGTTRQPSFNGSIKTLTQKMTELSRQGIQTYLTCDTKEEADRLRELIEEEQPLLPLKPETDIVQFLSETVHSGFIFPAARVAVFTEHEIFGRIKRRGLVRRRKFKGFTQTELQKLKRNDFVVHADYGIGRFVGLQKISVRGAEQEVMKILYLENDVVYVNLNYIDRVQKYASNEGHIPKLTKLGAPDWERLKARAKHRVKDIARDLIHLYALRKKEKGFAFSSDTHWQKEMEAAFVYEDTTDQAQATIDTKRDMESEAPMDRLICGDVGFGKTEVAVRAAFKAVQDGKQVAILVPTTILAQQHFHTFKDRLGQYPVRIEFISRFKNRKEQTTVVEGLRTGATDIIIGTHRLLSNDVHFKNLGLLVIDEEHRFGVAAKEKLRRMKTSVDTLTLTATPIPRTLHFSLMGARDISLINTPPRNRLPIITEIADVDWKLIREAILKEVHRGGQVYFIHDRIQRIEEMKSLLEEHVPGVRFAVAHGQMLGHQLEKIMVDFLERKYDVLISTKIIESGIDIPNVNTIVINRADRFGLAELYQLRGRVGRSNVQAYAYLLTPPSSTLSKEALRRLQAIEEFTELGSGFNLAMRDLEIRGTGNLLGAEQSGFIMEMGFEMYERIVREAVEELRREEFGETVPSATPSPHIPTTVEADIDAYIPEPYVESDSERLELYRTLSRLTRTDDVKALRLELRDRFGEYPPEVGNLLQLVELRILGARWGITRIHIDGEGIRLSLPDADNTEFYEETNGLPSMFRQLMSVVSERAAGAFRLKQEKKSLTLNIESITGNNRAESITMLLETFQQTP